MADAEDRRRRVREAREVAHELRDVENALADAQARIGPLLARATRLREKLERAVGTAEPRVRMDETGHVYLDGELQGHIGDLGPALSDAWDVLIGVAADRAES